MESTFKTKTIILILPLLFFSSCLLWQEDDKRDRTFFLKLISLFFRDETPLEVSSVLPKNNSTNNYRNTNIFIGFNKNIFDYGADQIKIQALNSSEFISGTFNQNGKFIGFTPNSILLANQTYVVSILLDKEQNRTYEFRFSTGVEVDTTAPRVLSTSPENGDINFPINAKIVINFSEALDPTTVTNNTFFLQGNPAGILTLQDQTLSFSPSGNLLPSSAYVSSVRAGIKDLAGNQMLSQYNWVFSTSDSAISLCTYDVGIFGLCLFD